MRSRHILIAMVLLLSASFASAAITASTCSDDGDGALPIQATWDPGPGMWSISGTQYWGPGHIMGDFTADSELDQTVWIVESVNNQTGLAWTDYHIVATLDKQFSIVGVVTPPDWTWNITAPSLNGTGKWAGTVDLYAGTDIPNGGTGNFGLVLSFQGSVQMFCLEQTPSYASAVVPAPAALLLGSIGLGCISWLRRRRSL